MDKNCTCQKKCGGCTKKLRVLEVEVTSLREVENDVKQIRKEVTREKEANRRLKSKLAEYEAELEGKEEENEELKGENEKLRKENEKVRKENEKFKKESDEWRNKFEELENALLPHFEKGIKAKIQMEADAEKEEKRSRAQRNRANRTARVDSNLSEKSEHNEITTLVEDSSLSIFIKFNSDFELLVKNVMNRKKLLSLESNVKRLNFVLESIREERIIYISQILELYEHFSKSQGVKPMSADSFRSHFDFFDCKQKARHFRDINNPSIIVDHEWNDCGLLALAEMNKSKEGMFSSSILISCVNLNSNDKAL